MCVCEFVVMIRTERAVGGGVGERKRERVNLNFGFPDELFRTTTISDRTADTVYE